MLNLLPNFITSQTVLPLIVAPMFLVSGPDLVLATCRAGVIGCFPVPNARTPEILDERLTRITAELAAERAARPTAKIAPYANLVVHRSYKRRAADLEVVAQLRREYRKAVESEKRNSWEGN